MAMNKTPITILQEMMIKRGEVPAYECINQTGPHHLATFEYKCVAGGVTATATARSKKEAKQEAARRVLAALNVSPGIHVPSTTPPAPKPVVKDKALPSTSQSGQDESEVGGAGEGQWRSYVALLKELCEEFRLGAVQYDLVGDTGPPHNRRFTISATLGSKSRTATASTKKQARQLAAEQLYHYLRENLASVTEDFVEKSDQKVRVKTEKTENAQDEVVKDSPRKRKAETEDDEQSKRSCDLDTLLHSIDRLSEDALSRALDKVMARYVEMKEEQQWRPDLGQRIADYHRGLLDNINEEQLKAAEAVERREGGEKAEEELRDLASALGLSVELEQLAGEGGELSVVSLGRTAPQLALAGRHRAAAAATALRYIRRSLAQRLPDPLVPDSPNDSYGSLRL